MKKRFLQIIVVILSLIFIIALSVIASIQNNTTVDSTESTAASVPTLLPFADMLISLDSESKLPSESYDIYVTSDGIASSSGIPHTNEHSFFSYHQSLSTKIARSLTLPDGGLCQYRLLAKDNRYFAFFYCNIESSFDAERMTWLLRCYQDYFPFIVLGKLSNDALTLISSACRVSLKEIGQETCITANAMIDYYIDSESIVLHFETPPIPLDLNKPMLALTYDDGPNIPTESILQTLTQNKAKATFYVNGVHVTEHQEIVQKIFLSGFEIGNHTNMHELFSQNTPSIIKKSIEETNQKLRAIIGVGAATVRPPGGETKDRNKKTVILPYPVILWTIDTLDYTEGQTVESILLSVSQAAKHGDIVLLHDSKDITEEASQELIPLLIAKGFQLITVSEMLEFTENGIFPDYLN